VWDWRDVAVLNGSGDAEDERGSVLVQLADASHGGAGPPRRVRQPVPGCRRSIPAWLAWDAGLVMNRSDAVPVRPLKRLGQGEHADALTCLLHQSFRLLQAGPECLEIVAVAQGVQVAVLV